MTTRYNQETWLQYKKWREKFKLHIHANGDKAIAHLLNLVDESNKAYPRKDHNTTLHHMGYFTDSLAERIKNMGAEASINPYYLWALSDKYTESGLGAQRAQNLVTANSLARRDINFSFHFYKIKMFILNNL